MSEEKIPDWLDTPNYIRTLNNTKIFEVSCEIIINDAPGHIKNTYYPEKLKDLANKNLPIVQEKLRYYDVKDNWHWGLSIFGSLLFFLIEIILVYEFDIYKSFSEIYFYGVVSLVLFCCYIFFAFFALYTNRFDIVFRKTCLKKKYLYPLTVFFLFFLLVGLNLKLVTTTGMERSPFLPALIFMALTIIGAPRENGPIINILNGTIFLIIVYIFYHTIINSYLPYLYEISVVKVDENLSNLSNILNVTTFIFSASLFWFLRKYSSNKFKFNEK